MADPEASVSRRKRISGIWLIPIVALVLGAYMVIHTFQSQGPLITIVFATGEGVEAGKTKIKYREVEVGLVESVGLDDDLESVLVTARLAKNVESLLREDTQFWVVRARVGPAGVSGLGTLLSGGYVQMSPGVGAPGRREFDGLELPPVTPAAAPGLHVKLEAERAGSVSTGDPILYRGFRVGGIESAEFDVASQTMRYGAFIKTPYDSLVTSSTRFWNASGLSVSATADGIEVDTASLEALLAGGVVFGLPDGVAPGDPVDDGEVFRLHRNFAEVNDRPHRKSVEYVVQFAQSVRGLKPGAPVEYRGIRIGAVEKILYAEMVAQGMQGRGDPIAVLIRVVPGRMYLPDTDEGVERLEDVVEAAVASGLRASLSTGSLLTGSLFVYFDMYPDAEPAEVGLFAGHRTIPTVASGFEGIQVRLTTLLDKVNSLPMEDLLADVDRLIEDLDRLVANEDLQQLPASLEATLAELRSAIDTLSADSEMQERLLRTATELDRTLRSLRQLLETLDEKPNAVIFNREPGRDPEPPAGNR